jgi:hypothetical protein
VPLASATNREAYKKKKAKRNCLWHFTHIPDFKSFKKASSGIILRKLLYENTTFGAV